MLTFGANLAYLGEEGDECMLNTDCYNPNTTSIFSNGAEGGFSKI